MADARTSAAVTRESLSHLRVHLSDADWPSKRDIFCELIQGIENGPTKVPVVLRRPAETVRALDPIMVTL
jgi:hypothetical protein